jgi:hypothetical protein
MSKNTDLADINEIYVGYSISKFWFDPEAKKQFEAKKKKVTLDEYDAQIKRAEVMAVAAMRWAKTKGYSGKPKVYWTARPGSLQEAVDPKGKLIVDSKKNPTDILLKFPRGPSNGFLGISAKSTKGSTDIGFKNPGIGTVEKNLKIELSSINEAAVNEAIKKFKLATSSNTRKLQIRSNKKTQEATIAMGTKVLSDIRNKLFKKVSTMNSNQLRDYILSDWLDASELYPPPYIKVTGMGSKPPYTAKVEDPLKNEKLSAILSQKILVEKVGNDSIGVKAGSKKILKMRVKYESEKLASSIKFSGDPWS